MNVTTLKCVSVIGQFLSVFPFVVLCEGVGYGRFTWWHYAALYGAFAVFYLIGRLCADWALSPARSRSFRPKAIFLSKAAIAVPLLIFLLVVAALQWSSGLLIYALPAAVIMYYGGYSTSGKEYADIFTRGWFALFFVTAVLTSVLLWFTHNDAVKGAGGFQLCFSFGVLIVISAVLTNQTNIDMCTHQRDAGKTVLPKGLRSYNGALVAAVVTVIVALCLFAAPAARLVTWLIKQLLIWLLSLIQGTRPEAVDDILSGTGNGAGVDVDVNSNLLANLLSILLFVGIGVLLIALRRHIISFFRELVAPLFRVKEEYSEAAFTDELSNTTGAFSERLPRHRREQQLYKLYRRESDPVKKYRTGYSFMLLRLNDTAFPPVDTDNTDIHAVKGEKGFRSDDVKRIVSTYNDVRYSGRVPDADELEFEAMFIEEIRRRI